MTTVTTRPSAPVPAPATRSLRARWRWLILLGTLALVILAVGTATLITFIEQRAALIRLQETSAGQVHAAAQEATGTIQRVLSLVAAAPDAPVTADRLESVQAAHPAIQSLDYIGPQGEGMLHVPLDDTSPAREWRDHPAYSAVMAGDVYASESASDPAALVIAVPGPETSSALVARVDAAALWGTIARVPVGDEGYAYVLGPDGGLLAFPAAGTPANASNPANFGVFEAAQADGSAMRVYDGLNGDLVIGRAEHWPDLNATVIVETPVESLLPVVVRLIGLWGLAVILALGVGEWLNRRVVNTVERPLGTLGDAARAVTAGDYRYRVRLPTHTERELAELGTAFNTMIGKLADTQRQLDAYANEMQEIVDLRARELWRKSTHMEVAATVSRAIATLRDPRALVTRVAELVQSQFQVYHVEILLVDEDTGRIMPGTGAPNGLGEISLHQATSSVIAWVVSSGETLYVPDVSDEPRYRRSDALPASQCELAIPLRFENRVLGVLNLEADHRDAFPRDQIEVLKQLADEIAISIHNAQAFKALEQANSELATATMHANQSNTLKSRFLYQAAQKLRVPLEDIVSTAEMLLSGVPVELPPAVQERQRVILDNGRVMQALVEDMLDLSAIEAGHMQLNLDWVTLLPLLEEVTNAARALHMAAHPDHEIDIRLDLLHLTEPLPRVRADIDRLRYILINLMNNAVTHTLAGEIVLSAHADPDAVRITVHDTGTGISDEELRYLFEPVQKQPVPEIDFSRGTGLGMPIARLLAMRHGGDITVETEQHVGTTFTLILPLPEEAPPVYRQARR